MKNTTIISLLAIVLIVLGIGFVLSRDTDAILTGADMTVREGDWTRGPATSSVVIIEYSDFQCPACRTYEPLVKQLLSERPDVTFVYRHFPLVTIHANADIAAEAAEAAGRQGKFWEMHDILFERQDAWATSPTARSVFASYATELGLDAEQFSKDILDTQVRSKVTNDYRLGMKAGVQGTPTFFLNGTRMEGVRSYGEFLAQVDRARGVQSSTSTEQLPTDFTIKP